MTDLLEHTILTTRARQLPEVGPSPPDEVPPAAPPTDRTPPSPHGPWPRNAKVVVAILAVATLFAGLGTFAATRDDGGSTGQQEQIELLTAEQARLTTELETANARVVALTTQRDELNDQISDLDAELATAISDVEELTAEGLGIAVELATATATVDELTDQRVALTAERDALQSSLAAAEAEVVDLETRLDTATDLTATLDERLAVLDVQVGYLLERATTAERERDTLLELFPIEFDSSLQGVDLVGDWNLSWEAAYCSGFSTCGTVPSFGRITITETPQRWLEVEADGVFDAGLFEVEGALYAITESRTAAPACDDVLRPAHVGLTLYAHGVTVADDGTHVIEDLGGTFVVDAPATGACPAGLAIYSAQLTPVG